MMIHISVNNNPVKLPGPVSITEFIAQHHADQPDSFALAINGEFLPRARYAETQLANGDQIDIVSPVGGG